MRAKFEEELSISTVHLLGKGLGTTDLTSGMGKGLGAGVKPQGEFSDLQLSPEILPRDHTLHPIAQMMLPWGSGPSHFFILTLLPPCRDRPFSIPPSQLGSV